MRRYPFGRFILEVPDGHAISEIHKTDVLYDRSFGFILTEISNARPGGVMLDIGGNVGDTAAFFATCVSNPILSVEGSAEYADYFRTNQRQFGQQVTLVEKFLRTESLSNLNLKFKPSSGTGHLEPSEEQGLADDKFISVSALLALATQGDRELCLVKTDTDGMDGFIVADMMDQVRVPLFFECDANMIVQGVESPWPSVFERLTADKYSVIVFDNFGLPMAINNKDPGSLLTDLSGYTHLQKAVNPTRIYYYDVWAFPPEWAVVFRRLAHTLRSNLLKPYLFPTPPSAVEPAPVTSGL